MEKIDTVISQAADKLIKAVEAYGPQATELVLATGRVAALQEIVWGAAWLVILVVACAAASVCYRRSAALPKYDDGKIGWALCIAGCGIAGSISLIGAIIGLFNVFAWVGMKHPEIYLAAKLLKL